MISKRKIAKTAATFGAAMTAMHAAPELQAQILEITWFGGNETATNPFVVGSASPQSFGIDQVIQQTASGMSIGPDFVQWNDTYYDGSGRTLNFGNGLNILSATVVALGQSLDPATFAGAGSTSANGVIGGSLNGSASAFIGFRAVDDNVGWFRIDYTVAGPIIYSEGEFATNGETVVVGGDTGGGPGGFVAPDSFTTFRGTVLSATLEDFAMSDDTSASYLPGFTIGPFEAPVWLIFDGVAADATSFHVESSAGTPGLTYTVEAFNWATQQFEEIGTQGEAFNTDQELDFPIVAADHIDAGGEVRTRVGWRRTGFTINFPWQVNVDQVGWNQ